MNDIKTKAIGLGIKPGRMKKAELIKTLQSREGNFPCFQAAKDYCDQYSCCWRTDCLPKAKQNSPQ